MYTERIHTEAPDCAGDVARACCSWCPLDVTSSTLVHTWPLRAAVFPAGYAQRILTVCCIAVPHHLVGFAVILAGHGWPDSLRRRGVSQPCLAPVCCTPMYRAHSRRNASLAVFHDRTDAGCLSDTLEHDVIHLTPCGTRVNRGATPDDSNVSF